MAAVASPTAPLDAGPGVGALDKDKQASSRVPLSQVNTPPTTDEGSHKDDDAASSSSLSDLGDDHFEDEENTMRFEEAARAGAEAEQHTEVKPDRYENNIPIFTPTMEEFQDFQKYVGGVNPYGMQSGIVLIDPPEEWKRARKALDDVVKTIKIKNPIMQEFHGAQGVYTQRNMEKMRSYNLPQWRSICEQTENQPPARRGEKRLNADKLLGRGTVKNKTKGEASPAPDGRPRRGRPTKGSIKAEPVDEDSSLMAPPTPTSPDVKPALPTESVEDEVEDIAEYAASRGKKGRKASQKPKGRQPKTTPKKDSNKSSETTVTARRLQVNKISAEEIDEEAYKDFDYRVYDNDQWTAERCSELEEKYWKSLNFSNPMYAADMAGSLFDDRTKEWNVAKLPSLLDLIGQPIPGVNTAYLYLGMWRATFAWHLEDVDLYSINYIHFGAPKQWYSISQKDAPKFEAAMRTIWGDDAKACDQFLRHKTYLVSPAILKAKFGVTVNKVVHREGQFVITFPIGYHSGYNLGYNCAESVNFAIPEWLQYGKTARKCQCEGDSVFIDVDWFIRKMNGEPTPEYEEVEVTDDEEDDDVMDLPTPPGSDRGKIKKRKRGIKDVGPNKRPKKLIKIRRISKNQPCCLCPNDFTWEELLPTTDGKQAHRTCAMYTPETYVASQDGKEMVHNIEGISKARMELKCYECRQKKGSCFQCSSAKCTKSYHATCAMQAGVQVDMGPIAVWHENVEYRDIGFDWRCRLHRSVKRSRITSELSTNNHCNSWVENKELKEYLFGLRSGALIQYQLTHADEIEAGLVVSGYDDGQGSLLVSVLPDTRVIKEVEPAAILFVDSSTSCLQKPSATALDLPEDLQGKVASFPDSTERKPTEGDIFTENPKTEWAEFVSAAPPHNKLQKKVNIWKPKHVWLYLGEPSSESKAQYTSDPSKLVNDPASNFLSALDLPRQNMLPPQPSKRQSLAASYPLANVAARNAAMVNMRPGQMQPLPGQQGYRPIQLGPQQQRFAQQSQSAGMNSQNPDRRGPNSQFKDQVIGDEAKANAQLRILQRQQAKAQHLDSQNGQPSPNIGIDRDAFERQRIFQQQASQRSSSASYDGNGLSPSLKQYHEPLPNYNTIGQGGSFGNQGRPQQPQYSNEWMNPVTHRPSTSGQHQYSTAMHSHSPQQGLGQSPGLRNGGFFQSFDQQSHMQSPHQYSSNGYTPQYHEADRIRGETARIESIRAQANQPPLPPPSAAVERQRRISNPAYPFKSPDQIKAQKEGKGSPPGSRPGSSYTMASPNMNTNASMDVSNPPQFINPNATQISPPGSSAGRRSASNSMSMPAGVMGPPMQPQRPRTMSNNMMDAAPFPMAYLPTVSSYVPRRSMYDPLRHHAPQPMWPMQATFQQIRAPMAEPSPLLVNAIAARSYAPNGMPVNDTIAAEQLMIWQQKGGFWGKVANYYIKKHDMQAAMYRSPFAPKLESGVSTANAFYEGLSYEGKQKVRDTKENGMQN